MQGERMREERLLNFRLGNQIYKHLGPFTLKAIRKKLLGLYYCQPHIFHPTPLLIKFRCYCFPGSSPPTRSLWLGDTMYPQTKVCCRCHQYLFNLSYFLFRDNSEKFTVYTATPTFFPESLQITHPPLSWFTSFLLIQHIFQ